MTEKIEITRQDEILVMRFLVTIMYEYGIINETEKEKIFSEYV